MSGSGNIGGSWWGKLEILENAYSGDMGIKLGGMNKQKS